MTKSMLCSVPTVFFLTVSTAHAQSFLCVGDKATGFSFNKAIRQWEITSFNVSQEKYIVRKPNERDDKRVRDRAYVVVKTGNSMPDYFCADDFDKRGIMRCRGINGRFSINSKLGRYISEYQFGYVDENELAELFPQRSEGDDTPGLTIGRCSPL